MPKIIKPLSETQCRNAKGQEKDYKLSDGAGMYLLVKPNGSKWWRINYRYNEKQKTLSLGVYPETSLAQAREGREKLRKLIKNGIDPSVDRKQKEQKRDHLLSMVGEEWLDLNKDRISSSWHNSVKGYLKNHINPVIGNKSIKDLISADVIDMAKRIERQGYLETTRRTLNALNQIYKYAVGRGYVKHNIIADIDRKNTFKRAPKSNYPVIVEHMPLGQLLCDIDNYHGNVITRHALQLAPHVFLRPANIRFAEWKEINFDDKIWRIPAEKMKLPKPHLIPLSKQMLVILKSIYNITGNGKYIFPSPTTTLRPISENTMLNALRRLDYTKEQIVVHSFRGIASTLLHENIPSHKIHSDAIERQLAHTEGNAVKAAYNHAEYLEERIKLMQWWSDFLEKLKMAV